MNVPLNLSSMVTQARVASSITLLITLGGCANPSLRHVSSESDILSPKVTPPIPTHTVEAEYPYLLKSSGVEGRVDVSCLIDENGAVVEASILRAANIDFVSSALEAVKEWRFAPGTHNNKPVPMRIVIPFQFNFEHEDPRFSR